MNKSLLALIFALPLMAACFGKKAENNEVVKTEAVHEEMAPAAHEEATEGHDEASEAHEEADHENDEK